MQTCFHVFSQLSCFYRGVHKSVPWRLVVLNMGCCFQLEWRIYSVSVLLLFVLLMSSQSSRISATESFGMPVNCVLCVHCIFQFSCVQSFVLRLRTHCCLETLFTTPLVATFHVRGFWNPREERGAGVWVFIYLVLWASAVLLADQ